MEGEGFCNVNIDESFRWLGDSWGSGVGFEENAF